jgi:hypothetical protein
VREQAARESARRRADFLARAGTMLASSLDYQSALGDVARLVVPDIADWAFFSPLDDDALGRSARNEEHLRLLRALGG